MREKPAIRPDEVHGHVRITDLEHVEARIGAVEKPEFIIARCYVQLRPRSATIDADAARARTSQPKPAVMEA
jgi:hypothetical protein